jgi:hypothetical protein
MARILKRKTAMTSRRVYKHKALRGKKKSLMGVKNIRAVVNKVLARKIETKQSTSTVTDGTVIKHNNFIVVDPTANFLRTNNGTGDPMTGTGDRIGDEITLKGISIKMMIQNNPRFNNVTFRLLLVRSAKGDTPTRATLFRGLSGNKMLDSINYERYSIIAQKMFKINNQGVASNAGLISSVGVEYGIYGIDNTQTVYSPPTKIIRMYIPGAKIAKGGVIKYEDLSTSQVKFFDYTLVLFAYANLSTSQDLVDIALINDYVKTMYYTDA